MAKSADRRFSSPKPPRPRAARAAATPATPGGKPAIRKPAPVQRNSSSRADGLWLGCPSDGGLAAPASSGVRLSRFGFSPAKYP